MNTITVQALRDRMNTCEVILLDVRTPAEFETLHAETAINIPLDTLTAEAVESARQSSGEPVYVICQSGSRAKSACAKLSGCTNLVVVEGGTQAWRDQNLPVIRGRQTISLERQVRIAAGSLVVIGTLLGATLSSYFLILSGFVGAGLVFAGVTDTCGMGILLSKCPWNQTTNADCRVEAH